MKTQHATLALLTCLLASALVSRADVDNDCNPVNPASSPSSPCHAIWLEIQDIKLEIHSVGEALHGRGPDGSPHGAPSGPQKADLLKREKELDRSLGTKEGELRRCLHIRQSSAAMNGDLEGNISIVVPPGSQMTAGNYSEPVHPAEVRVHFTANGCTATVLGLPSAPLRGPAAGAGIALSQPSLASGEYHPISGRMTLSFRTRLDLAPGIGGPQLTPADATITLAFPGPRSPTRHVRLEGDGHVSGGNSGLQSIHVVFDGTLALPAP